MFVNRLNQLYKPERVLYYLDATESDIADFYAGKFRQEIAEFSGAFGTYDIPGIFFIKELGKEVIGIEFRGNDERVAYPMYLKSIVLKGSFFYSIEIDKEVGLTHEYVKKLFERIAADDDAHRIYSDLSVKKNPGVIGVFTSNKIRILYEMQVDSDQAISVIEDDYGKFDKKVLYTQAFTDPITGHYNWNHLVPFLEMPMDKGIQDYAFVHFDIKEFHVINEIYGHTIANRFLRNVVNAMNEADFVYASARCHNDNFAMIIRDMPEEETIKCLKEFFSSLSPLEEDPNHHVYFRCGVVPMMRSMLYGNRVADAGKMAQALGNRHDKTDIIIYTDKMHDDILWGSYIKAYLDTAIENDEFVVFLQPKIDIQNEKIKGAEALIRWNYRKEEFLYPSRFIPFFEKDGSIGKVDDLVLKKVCEYFAKWKNEDRPLHPVSVNLSRESLYDRSLVDRLTEIVDSYGVDHGLIDFELTESASYDNTEQMIKVLGELRKRGFKISMDDFGTGYSSFSLLTQMPLDTLKIDKSFVDKVGTGEDEEKDVVVIKHIIALAKELGITCLAEGAENKGQVDKLRTLGCEVIQGYYYSKPLAMEEYEGRYL